MSGNGNEPVRRALLIRTALEVLAEAGVPLPRSEVLDRVGQSMEMTPYEAAPFRDGESLPRWENHLTWASTDMKAAGWIDKTPAGWAITPAGRNALVAYPADGAGMEIDSSRAYQQQYRMRKQAKYRSTGYAKSILEAAFELLEPGLWTTFADLAEVADTNVQTVSSFLKVVKAEAIHRVLGKDRKPDPSFDWPEARDATQRETLEAEGVEFLDSGQASPRQHLRASDFKAYLEDSGVINPGPRRAWLVRSAIDGNELLEAWLQEGVATLRASKLRQVEAGIPRSELKSIVDEDYSQSSYAAKAARLDEFDAFLSRMRLDDIVVTTSQGIFRLGTVTGDAEYAPGTAGNLRRTVTWHPTTYPQTSLDSDIQARLQIPYDVVELTQQLDLLQDMLQQDPALPNVTQPPTRRLVLPDATAQLAVDLNVDEAWLQECIDLLRDRPQLIFYGPPGTGKTFIAQHLANHLAKDSAHVRLVQFHPAYSYEDFFEGYRPEPSGGFALKPGPLRKTVDAAKENPHAAYFLIIDEINRGNLAKIFGELYFLLEYRDQQVDLLYATDDDVGFTLPKNVFIIGTMNTADRSIALVDAAMRRRFSFVALHPSEPPTAGVLRRWLRRTNRDPLTADLLDELNRRIEDPDFKIGPSYFMRDAVHTDGGLERAWRTAILPLLEEHHYGEGIDVPARYGLAAIRSAVQTRAASNLESGAVSHVATNPA